MGALSSLFVPLPGPQIFTTRVGMVLMANGITRPEFLPAWFTVADVFIVVVAGTTVIYQFPARCARTPVPPSAQPPVLHSLPKLRNNARAWRLASQPRQRVEPLPRSGQVVCGDAAAAPAPGRLLLCDVLVAGRARQRRAPPAPLCLLRGGRRLLWPFRGPSGSAHALRDAGQGAGRSRWLLAWCSPTALQMKIIYAYVTKTAFPIRGTVLLIPLVFGAVNANAQAWFGVYVRPAGRGGVSGTGRLWFRRRRLGPCAWERARPCACERADMGPAWERADTGPA